MGEKLHPHFLMSYNMQLPSAVGSPVFNCPVPVVQGYTNLLPVDTIKDLLSIKCSIY